MPVPDIIDPDIDDDRGRLPGHDIPLHPISEVSDFIPADAGVHDIDGAPRRLHKRSKQREKTVRRVCQLRYGIAKEHNATSVFHIPVRAAGGNESANKGQCVKCLLRGPGLSFGKKERLLANEDRT